MKFFRNTPAPRSGDVSAAKVDRRKLVLGAGVAGAAAVAAQTLSSKIGPVIPADVVAKAPRESGDGYQVTQHVLRYYETAKV